MGYESQLFIVKKNSCLIQEIDGKERVWGEVIATFDLCKAYEVSDKMRRFPATDCYIYAVGADVRITDDMYGQELREVPLEDACRILREAWKQEDYQRYEVCYMMLKAFADNGCHDDLVVLHYGY